MRGITIISYRGYKSPTGKNVRGFFDMEVKQNEFTWTIRDNTLYVMPGGPTFFRLPCKKISKERYINLIEVVDTNQWKHFQGEVLKELNAYLIEKMGKPIVN